MRKRNPKTTITGKIRIKPFSLTTLLGMVETTTRRRDKDKMVNRIKALMAR